MRDDQDYQHLLETNERFKRDIEWYKRTYEDRSLLGVVKEKCRHAARRSYIRLLNGILKNKLIRKKYAVSFALEYAREKGIKKTVGAVSRVFQERGIQALTHSRSILHHKLMQRHLTPQFSTQPSQNNIDLDRLQSEVSLFKYKPKISVVFPAYNTKPALLHVAIASIKAQVYTNWEICIVDDCSTNRETKQALEQYVREKNIKVRFLKKNAGISDASNEAIKMATGAYVALMDHDDEITPDALFWIVNELNEHIDADIIYSDECKVDEQGNLSDYFLKPDWSPELMINMMYTGHLTVYKTSFLLEKVGLFRKAYDFSQDYDLMLRASEKTDNIYHIKKVLYHWRLTEGSASQGDKPYARITNLAALEDAAKRRGIVGDVIELPTANRLKITFDQQKKVSIIIPTDSYTNLRNAIESIQTNTIYPNYEIVVVTNSRLILQMKERFSYTNICYAVYDKPYNFSDKCNIGALYAAGEVLVFFNDDVRPLQADWLENTIEFLEVAGVGGVSPKLVYENDTIQYAGMAAGVRNLTGTTFHCYHKDSTQYINFPQLVRNVSILSGACMALRKSLFLQLDGFDAVHTPSAHSDVDLSFKILDAGLRCVYTPYAALRHIGHLALGEHEKKEPKLKKDKADIFLLRRWVKYLSEDNYFTGPMKNMLYHDSPEPYTLHAPVATVPYGSKGDVLLISHDLSLSGAPIMLYDTAKVLMQNGYYVIVICPEDGPLRHMYQQAGIAVIVDALALKQHPSFERFARNFDYLICNTVVTWPIVQQMQDIVKCIWWIQEGQVINLFTGNAAFLDTIRNAKHLVGVSNYSISYVKEFNKNISKIYNACYDVHSDNGAAHGKKESLIFCLIGSVESRKGHDLLISALEKLPLIMHAKMEMWLIGRVLDHEFFERLKPRIEKLKFIRFFGEQSHDACLKLMNKADVVLNTSRDDPFPVVLVEAMCMKKTCIISSNSGLAELIKPGENGFVFQNENPSDLFNKIETVLNAPDHVETIGCEARKTYEEHLTIERFESKLLELLSEI